MTYAEYLEARERLQEENSNQLGVYLKQKERLAAEKLEQLKEELSEAVEDETLYKMNLLKNSDLWNSRLYQAVKQLPKGSDLHVHATSIIPGHLLIDFVISRPELVVDPADCRIYNVKETFPETCRPLGELLADETLTREELVRRWTLLGRKHNENVWDYFEILFVLFDSIEYDEETLFAYNVFAFRHYLENHVSHIEIHALFSDRYERTKELALTLRRAYYAVKREHPELIVSVICSGMKYLGIDQSMPKQYLTNALRLREEVVDDFDPADPHPFIIGFDLLNEEDKSIPLKELAPMFLECREKYPDFNFFIHCGESLMAQSDNLIDAYLLGAARVGHGMNLYRFPGLLNKYAEKEICLESCPISNKALRYVKDLRLHPTLEYLRRGLAVALCSDDPNVQEHEVLTDDFFAGIVCWNLNLSDVKQLCVNSILYSGLQPSQKSTLIAAWKKQWEAFIDTLVDL